MHTVQLNTRALLALIPLTAGPDMFRKSLEGVYFAPDGKGIATSGHVLGVYRNARTLQEGEPAPPQLHMRAVGKWAPILSALRKALPKHGDPRPCTLTIEGDATADYTHAVLTVSPPKGVDLYFAVEVTESDVSGFPSKSWQQVIPRPDALKPVGLIRYNPKLLTLFGDKPQFFFSTPERAALVRTDDPDFFGIVMPLRAFSTDNGHAEQDWVRDVHGSIAREREFAEAQASKERVA
jgi:hypothetical protein